MAKTKKTSVEPSEEKVTLEEAAIVAEEMPVTAADEVAEQPAAAEETAASFGDKVKAFGGKIKEFFVGVGVKTKTFSEIFSKRIKRRRKKSLAKWQLSLRLRTDKSRLSSRRRYWKANFPPRKNSAAFAVRSPVGCLFCLP